MFVGRKGKHVSSGDQTGRPGWSLGETRSVQLSSPPTHGRVVCGLGRRGGNRSCRRRLPGGAVKPVSLPVSLLPAVVTVEGNECLALGSPRADEFANPRLTWGFRKRKYWESQPPKSWERFVQQHHPAVPTKPSYFHQVSVS